MVVDFQGIGIGIFFQILGLELLFKEQLAILAPFLEWISRPKKQHEHNPSISEINVKYLLALVSIDNIHLKTKTFEGMDLDLLYFEAWKKWPKFSSHFIYLKHHLESRWRNSHVLVYHGPLTNRHLLGVAPSTFTLL